MHLPQSRRRRAGGVPWVTVSAYRPLASSSPAEIIEMYMLSPKGKDKGKRWLHLCAPGRRFARLPRRWASPPRRLPLNTTLRSLLLDSPVEKESPPPLTPYTHPWELRPTAWTFGPFFPLASIPSPPGSGYRLCAAFTCQAFRCVQHPQGVKESIG